MNRNKEEMVSCSLKIHSYFTKATTLEKQGDPVLSLCKNTNDRSQSMASACGRVLTDVMLLVGCTWSVLAAL